MSDYIIKATAADNYIRAYAATTAELVEEARQRHNTSPIATAALGRLLTAGAMMGSMMKSSTDKLTLKINGNGPIGSIVVNADADANVRGFVNNPNVMLPATSAGKLDVAGAIGIGMLSVTRDLGIGKPFTGQCILATSEIAEDLTYYYATSEQIPSSVALGVQMNKNNTVKHAGGFIIQLLPNVPEEIIGTLETKIKEISAVTALLDKGMSPEDILKQVLGGMSLHILEKIPAKFSCSCSRDSIIGAIKSINKDDVAEWIRDERPVEAVCDFCGEKYLIEPDELKKMFNEE